MAHPLLNPFSCPADQITMAKGREPNTPIPGDVGRGLEVGTPEQFRWLHGIVKAVLVLNVIDAILTLVWVRAGLATEANTLIDELVRENALVFISIKVGLVALGSWVLWRRRRHPFAVVGIFVVFLAYYGILLYHLRYASTLVRNTLEIG